MRYLGYEEKLARCFSSVLMDTLDKMDCRDQCLDPSIRPLTPFMRMWGEAVTANFVAVSEVPKKPFELEIKIVDDLKEGQILVSHCGTKKLSAAWGGLLSTAARVRKARGVVTDGGARDYLEITQLDFPTFCRGLTPYDSLGRMDVSEINVPIVCGGVKVAPGDLIFADVDGTVVIPQEIAVEVIEKAWEKVRGENKVRDILRSGASVTETFEKFGIL